MAAPAQMGGGGFAPCYALNRDVGTCDSPAGLCAAVNPPNEPDLSPGPRDPDRTQSRTLSPAARQWKFFAAVNGACRTNPMRLSGPTKKNAMSVAAPEVGKELQNKPNVATRRTKQRCCTFGTRAGECAPTEYFQKKPATPARRPGRCPYQTNPTSSGAGRRKLPQIRMRDFTKQSQ
jgi:hypothetical protein